MKPYYDKDGITIYCGDSLEVMPQLEENSIDTVLTDPPYGLKFMGKDWDRGVPGVAFWEAASRVAKPGAMLLAFGGTRTHHRLTCAIEDAGWEIRDCMMYLYGTGFPKSHNISKAIDKAAGAEREVKGTRAYPDIRGGAYGSDYSDRPPNVVDITAPATEAAQLWDGWGTALKPAWEPIIVAMNPLAGTFAQNALEHGVAGLWIDGGRVKMQESDRQSYIDKRKSFIGMTGKPGGGWKNVSPQLSPDEFIHNSRQGRWPANVLLSHSPGCVRVGSKRVVGAGWRDSDGAGEPQPDMYGGYEKRKRQGYADADGLETVDAYDCVEGCAVRMLAEQSGERVSGGYPAEGHQRTWNGIYGRPNKTPPQLFGKSEGTAARFFYCAKASRAERNADGLVENNHPTVKPLAIMRYLLRLTSTPTGGVVLDPFMGSGTTLVEAQREGRRAIGIDISEESCKIAVERLRQRSLWSIPSVPTDPDRGADA